MNDATGFRVESHLYTMVTMDELACPEGRLFRESALLAVQAALLPLANPN